MQIFTRQLRLMGANEAAAWAVAITERGQEVSGMPMSLWTAVAGLPTGSFAWSVPIEGMGQIGEVNAKLTADAKWNELAGAGRDYIAEVMPDRVLQLIHGEVTEPAAVGTYMFNVNAVATEGNAQAAGAWAVKIADMWGGLTGISPVVTTTVAGPMFEFSWFARHPDGDAIDASIAKTMASPEYAAEIDNAGGLFHPGASQAYAVRLA